MNLQEVYEYILGSCIDTHNNVLYIASYCTGMKYPATTAESSLPVTSCPFELVDLFATSFKTSVITCRFMDNFSQFEP